jgi:uncharacterized protein
MQGALFLRIYLSESDHLNGEPAMQAVLDLCRKAGLTGVSVMRGIEGMGLHGVHTSAFLSLSSDLPLIIEAIDSPEKIQHAIELLRPQIGNRLLATWPVSMMRKQKDSA